MPVALECKVCGASFEVKPYRSRSASYCSRKCHDSAASGSTSPNCLECGEPKDIDDFYVDRSKRRGRVARCKACYRAKQKVKRLGPKRRFSEAKSGAIKRGLSWNLTYDQYLTWLFDGECYYCGEPGCNGIDRLNNEGFYDETNTVTCCGQCNRMKSDLRLADFLNRIRVIHERLGPAIVKTEETREGRG